MVILGEIELGEPSRTLSLVEQGVDVRQGFDEGLGDGVETPVVVADAPRSVGFARKNDRRRMPCRRRLDPAAVQEVEELPAQFRVLAFGKTLDWPSPRHGSVASVEHQLDAAVGWQPQTRAAQDIRIFRLQRCEYGMIGALEVQRGIDKSHRCEVKLCAIRQELDSGRKANGRRCGSATPADPSRATGLSSCVQASYLGGTPGPVAPAA
jgi:hypothetical protein